MSHRERCTMCHSPSEVVIEYQWYAGTLCERCLSEVLPLLEEAHILPLKYKRIYRTTGNRRFG